MASLTYTIQPKAPETARQYARQAVSGEILVCNYVRQACQRFLDDLEHAEARGFYMNWKAAQRAVDFFGFLPHIKGIWAKTDETRGFRLAPWQVFIITNLFGWITLKTGQRRFREAHIEVARKNGKSTFIAGIGLYMVYADGEPGAEVFSAATTKEQAHIVFDVAFRMVAKSPFLMGKIQKFGTDARPVNLHVDETSSKFEPLASDSTKLDGLNVHCALIDELHEHPTRMLFDVLNTGTGSRSQPLVIAITTAGFDREGICWDQREYGVKVLKGITPDENFFAYIATLDDGDKWDDEANWPKANPNMGVSTSFEKIRPNFIKAKEQPAALNEFLRKHLNVWTSSDTSWLAAGGWEKCCVAGEHADAVKLRLEALEKLRGRRCFGGLDMASTDDIAALTLVFPPCERMAILSPKEGYKILQMIGSKEIKIVPELNAATLTRASEFQNPSAEELPFVTQEIFDKLDKSAKALITEKVETERDDKWSILPWFWIPEAFAEGKAKKNRAPYEIWVKSKLLTATPGNAIAQEAIRNKVLELHQLFRLGEIGYDQWETGWVGPKLLQDGMKMVKIPQRFEFLSGPTKFLTNLITLGDFEHYNNPILRWMASNVQLLLDSNGSQRPDKGKSKNKIDGVVAAVMAVGRAMTNPVAAGADNIERFKIRML